MKNTKRLVTSAMLISLGTAISLVCEFIPFLNLPFGGTITLASLLPIVLASYLYGVPWGLGVGFVYSLLQMAVGFRTVSALFLPDSDSYMGATFAILILLLDYVLAFTLVGLGGLFRRKLSPTKALVLGSVIALTLCYLSHVLSGAIFYGAWAEWFFSADALGLTAPKLCNFILSTFSGAGLATVYSFIYNGLYMLPEIIITAIAAATVARLPFVKKG